MLPWIKNKFINSCKISVTLLYFWLEVSIAGLTTQYQFSKFFWRRNNLLTATDQGWDTRHLKFAYLNHPKKPRLIGRSITHTNEWFLSQTLPKETKLKPFLKIDQFPVPSICRSLQGPCVAKHIAEVNLAYIILIFAYLNNLLWIILF